ncbi:hypothetical protein Q3C01_23845 [Bradyrhizobium sp. UFLA05-109]
MMRTFLLMLAVAGLVLAGEFGRIVLAAACGGALYLAFRIGYGTGAEDREAAITALTAPLNSETHGPLPFASMGRANDNDFEREMQTAQRLAGNDPGTGGRGPSSIVNGLRSIRNKMWPTGTAVPKSGSIRANC